MTRHGTPELLATLKIDPEFRDKIPPLTEAEFQQLRENIMDAGEVYEPIRVWNGVVVDGHNRLKVIQEQPEIKWSAREMEFSDKWAAFDWMYRNQLGRRNLTDEQRTYMIGKMYEARKKSHGASDGFRGNQTVSSQNANLPNGRTPRTDEIIGKEIGVNHSTVVRAEKFAKGIDALKKVSPEAASKVLSGKTKAKKAEIVAVATANAEEVKRTAEAINRDAPIQDAGEAPKPKKKPNVGRPTEMRELMDTINAAYKPMVDPNFVPTYGIDDLIEEIEANGESYVNSLRNTISIRTALLDGDDMARMRVFKAIAKVIQDITRVRGEFTT